MYLNTYGKRNLRFVKFMSKLHNSDKQYGPKVINAHEICPIFRSDLMKLLAFIFVSNSF